MKIRHLTIIFLMALAATLPARAAENAPYFGLKGGWMNPDASGHGDAVNAGAVVGFKFFDDSRGSMAVEGEITASAQNGDHRNAKDWNVDTIAAYFAYRTANEVFLKGKAGVADQKPNHSDDVPDHTGFSFGFGVGWQMTRKSSLELEYTVLKDLNFISVGYYTHF